MAQRGLADIHARQPSVQLPERGLLEGRPADWSASRPSEYLRCADSEVIPMVVEAGWAPDPDIRVRPEYVAGYAS